MSSVPLHCTICPKRPNFSDVSHLLTHVSSKGHLSHLHKLQVRSHQDINAGQQLTIYNTWYQDNGIGQLLSERLFQKQAKKAQARSRTFPAATNHRRRQSTTSTSTTDPGLAPGWGIAEDQTMLQHPHNGLHCRTSHLVNSREHSTSVSIKSDDESDYDSSPIRRHRRHKNSRTKLTLSLRAPQTPTEDHWTDDEVAGVDLDDPEQGRLKGIYWPGMSIFDSAPDEMKKKRNQKKDGSLLKQMEKTSEVVEPQEVIYSPKGSLAKVRLITGMVEDSSPLKGESPVPKKRLPKPKRSALAPVSSNIPYRPRRDARPKNLGAKATERQNRMWPDLTNYKQVASRHSSNLQNSTTFTPTEDENREFRLTVGNLKPRSSGIQVFKDHRNGYSTQPKLFPFSPDGVQEYRTPTISYGSGSVARPGLNGGNGAFWLRPPHSQPSLTNHLFSPERSHSSKTAISPLYNRGLSKDVPDPFMQQDRRTTHHNPFEWDGLANLSEPQRFGNPATDTQVPSMAHNMIPSQHDSSGFGVNPLSFAFQKLQEPADSFARTDNSHESGLQPNGFASPNGTLSDPGFDLPFQF